jgi:hypothetical protein
MPSGGEHPDRGRIPTRCGRCRVRHSAEGAGRREGRAGSAHKEGVSLIGALVGEHLRETLSFTHPALKIAATLLGAAAKPLRARLRQAAIMPENDVMLAVLLHPTTVSEAVLAFTNAEMPTRLMARQRAGTR